MSKKRVLILGSNMMIIYHHRIDLIKALFNHGYEVWIISPYGDEKKLLLEEGCSVILLNIKNRSRNPFSDYNLYRSLLKLIAQINPDIILTFYTKTNIYGGLAASKLKIPYIINVTGLGTAIAGKGIVSKAARMLYRQAVRNADLLFFQNESNLQFFRDRNMLEAPFEILPGSGVNLNQYHILKYPENKDVEFLFISRILKEKGIIEYIEAAKLVKQRYPATKFHVVGPFEDNLKSYIKEAEEERLIKYHGKLNELHEILNKIHCTVLPSYYPEGMANVLLESAASGRPVITTNNPGCRETVDDNISGYIVPIKDIKSLADAMIKFIKLPLSEKIAMGMKGREKMEREFNREIVSNAYINALSRILNDRLR